MGRGLGFEAIDVGDGTGEEWVAHARVVWPFVRNDLLPAAGTPEGEARVLALFAEYMPELVPVLHRLAGALDRPGGAALLTQLALKPFFGNCSQTAVDGVLVRNYDFHPDQCERTIVASHFLRPVIGMNDLLWGLLDGMNDAGLAVSLTFGGRFVQGPGCGILMVVRYLLETCASVAEALAALDRLPIATAQNLTLVDDREAVSVYLGPDRKPAVAGDVCVTNHQEEPVPPGQEEFGRTMLRHRTLRSAPPTVDGTVEALLRPPLYQTRYDEGLGTLYTAAYRVADGRVSYVWPAERLEQSFARFTPGRWTVEVG